MKIIGHTGTDDLALVYLAKLDNGQVIEFLESVQPPFPRHKKWVLIVSTLCGCPVRCPVCDAGSFYHGKLSCAEIIAQIDYLISSRYPDHKIPAEKFKIQFARMGEPAFNMNLMEVLRKLPDLYHAPGLMPCISSVAPRKTEQFFEELLVIKRKLYQGRFQLQFSIHSTDKEYRDKLIPIKKWDFSQIADYGRRFFSTGDRKITLNFALVEGAPVETEVLLKYFDPEQFLIKITPLNPTYQAEQNNLKSYIDVNAHSKKYEIVSELRSGGYDVIVSIGEVEENKIGSNCGQYVREYENQKNKLTDAYSYPITKVSDQ